MMIDRIRVMISSRCKDYLTVDGAMFPLSRVRLSLQRQIDEIRLFDEQLVECLINELEPSKPANAGCLETIGNTYPKLQFGNSIPDLNSLIAELRNISMRCRDRRDGMFDDATRYYQSKREGLPLKLVAEMEENESTLGQAKKAHQMLVGFVC